MSEDKEDEMEQSSHATLIKLRPTLQKIRKVVLIGNGAVNGGDSCVTDAIRSFGSVGAEIHAKMDYGVPLAFYAANIRTIRNVLIQRILQADEAYERDICEYRKSLIEAESLREAISRAFSPRSDQTLKLRSEVQKYVPDLAQDDVGVVTLAHEP